MRCSKTRLIHVLVVALCATAGASDSANSFVHKKKYVMGTVFEIVAYDDSVSRASSAIEDAFAAIVELDNMMSNYRKESELSQLNRSAAFHFQAVSKDLYRIVEASMTYSRLSEGKFDVTVGPLVDLWKASLQEGTAPTPAQEARARECVGYEKVVLAAHDRILFRSSCLHLDLGGIGKGYAVDRAVEVLRKHGIRTAMVDAGGSTIFAMGSPPGEDGWTVHLRDPSRKIDPTVKLRDASVSTSEQSPPGVLQKTSAGHIIDPETGVPLNTRFAVSVIAKTATASDALSTTLLLSGPAAGGRLLHKMDSTAAIWIANDGEMHTETNGPAIVTEQLQSRCHALPAAINGLSRPYP